MQNTLYHLAAGMLAAICALPVCASAQTNPCAVNLVTNGGFEALLFHQWQVAGSGAVTLNTGSVDGLTTSRRANITGSAGIAISQPAPFQLQAALNYEVGFDAEFTSSRARPVSIDILDSSGTAVFSFAASIGAPRSRVAGEFSVATPGNHTIRINFGANFFGTPCSIDNVYIRENPRLFRFVSARAAGTALSYRVTGNPNEQFVVLVGGTGRLPAPIIVPGCYGAWELGLPTGLLVVPQTLSAAGDFTGQLTVPTALRGVAFEFQPAMFPPACGFGCASTFAFF